MQVIVITGPTGTGKSKLSVALAKKLNGEIINADSTQVYRDLNIATAKITKIEQENIPHHLFDIKDIDETYTVYEYQKDARQAIEESFRHNKTPILVGGTGLYLKAALYDYQFNLTAQINYEEVSTPELYKQLKTQDPATKIHPHNRKRIINALNYIANTGLLASTKPKTHKLIYDTIFIGLTTERATLYDHINHRVDAMIQNGLLEEAKWIYSSGIRTKAITTPIGYKELFPYFEGKQSLEACLEQIKTDSRHYAKRQYTWFNHQMNLKWFKVDYDDFEKTIDEVYQYIKEKSV